MRLIGRHSNLQQAQEFCFFLQSEGIHNQLDWNEGEAAPEAMIWIEREEDLPQAREWWLGFSQDPTNPMFYGHLKEARQVQEREARENSSENAREIKMRVPRAYPRSTDTVLTLFILFMCCLIYAFGEFGAGAAPEAKNQSFKIQLKRVLMFDYSARQEIIDRIQNEYGPAVLQRPDQLPPEGRELYQKALQTPAWEGLYPIFLPRNLDQSRVLPPLFEKIQQGEIWRFFTPCLLHLDFFHIFFNMLWLLILGSQMESRIGSSRYLIFILMVGSLSNLGQYLMSGPNFLGISGVVCGMAAFIWIRQQKAPWEGYNLPKVTFLFLLFFITMMLMIQFFSFLMEATGGSALAPDVANTAHLVGGLSGALLARIKFFEWKQ